MFQLGLKKCPVVKPRVAYGSRRVASFCGLLFSYQSGHVCVGLYRVIPGGDEGENMARGGVLLLLAHSRVPQWGFAAPSLVFHRLGSLSHLLQRRASS